jgi:hypothetical protein
MSTMLDAFSSVRTFIPTFGEGVICAAVGTGVAAAGFEGFLYWGSFGTAIGDEWSWILFPEPQ